MRHGRSLFVGAALVACAFGSITAAAGQLKTPADWKWLTDEPAKVVETEPVPPNATYFVTMAPGWHVTTGPGSLLFHPDYAGKGNFSVEAEIHLFPGQGAGEYGVFLGGRELDAQKSPSYVAFLARRDGRAAVLRLGAMSPVVDWKPTAAVVPQTGPDAQKNILRVDVNAADVVFSANGKEVIKLPRSGLVLDGQFGFRIGKGVNLHASRLDVTHRLAPVPVKK